MFLIIASYKNFIKEKKNYLFIQKSLIFKKLKIRIKYLWFVYKKSLIKRYKAIIFAFI